jgi:hypothetical protein
LTRSISIRGVETSKGERLKTLPTTARRAARRWRAIAGRVLIAMGNDDSRH